MMRHCGQYGDLPVTALRREPEPRHEAGNILQRRRLPVEPVTGQVGEPVLQIMGISLDRVRRLLDRGQIGQEPLHRLQRDLIVAEQSPRLRLRTRHQHPLHAHPTSRSRDGQQEITTSTTMTGKTSAQVVHVTDGDLRAIDNGRKRHIAADTAGLLLEVLATPASVQDRDAARPLLFNLHRARRRVRRAWADSVYAGQLQPWAATYLKLTVEIVKRPQNQHTFEVLPRRWVVERTLAWITSYRRCARDYERLPAHHEAAVYWAMITIMTRRLARPG